MGWFGPQSGSCSCCTTCEDLVATVSYTSAGIFTVTVTDVGGGGNEPADITVTKNGSTIISLTDQALPWGSTVAVARGDVITVTAVNSCSTDSDTCTYYDPYVNLGSCEFVDWPLLQPFPVPCWSQADLDALIKPNTNRSFEVSGITGPASSLNGVYNIGCLNTLVTAFVGWTDGFPYGGMGVVGYWNDEWDFGAAIESRHGTDTCIQNGNCNTLDDEYFWSRRDSYYQPSYPAPYQYHTQLASCTSCQWNGDVATPTELGALQESDTGGGNNVPPGFVGTWDYTTCEYDDGFGFITTASSCAYAATITWL